MYGQLQNGEGRLLKRVKIEVKQADNIVHTTMTDSEGWFILHYPCLYKGYDEQRNAYIFIKKNTSS